MHISYWVITPAVLRPPIAGEWTAVEVGVACVCVLAILFVLLLLLRHSQTPATLRPLVRHAAADAATALDLLTESVAALDSRGNVEWINASMAALLNCNRQSWGNLRFRPLIQLSSPAPQKPNLTFTPDAWFDIAADAFIDAHSRPCEPWRGRRYRARISPLGHATPDQRLLLLIQEVTQPITLPASQTPATSSPVTPPQKLCLTPIPMSALPAGQEAGERRAAGLIACLRPMQVGPANPLMLLSKVALELSQALPTGCKVRIKAGDASSSMGDEAQPAQSDARQPVRISAPYAGAEDGLIITVRGVDVNVEPAHAIDLDAADRELVLMVARALATYLENQEAKLTISRLTSSLAMMQAQPAKKASLTSEQAREMRSGHKAA